MTDLLNIWIKSSALFSVLTIWNVSIFYHVSNDEQDWEI